MPVFLAPRKYNPGELIYSEEAFAAAWSSDLKHEICNRCCKRLEVEITCDECSSAKYCGDDCKAKDSSDHKLECGKISKPPMKHNENHFPLLYARVILRVKGKDWKSITRNVLGTEISFDDLDSHYEEMTTYPKLILYCEYMEALLKEFIGEENMPEKEDLIKIIGKVRNSSYSISGGPLLFCFGSGSFKIECIPNSNYDACNNVMKIWAAKKIKASEEINISTTILFNMNLPRQPINNDSPVLCKCTECSVPYGESVLTKILDEEKAYKVIGFSEKILKCVKALTNFGLLNKVEMMRHFVDAALLSQEGVIGPTNALHLKLLAVKALMLEGISPLERRHHVMELEKNVSSVFGEYFKDLTEVYHGLCLMNYEMGDSHQARIYKKKIQIVEQHRSTGVINLTDERIPRNENTKFSLAYSGLPIV